MSEAKKQNSFVHPWPLGIFLTFLVVISVNMYFLWRANETPSQLVTEDYYAQSLVYDDVIEAANRTEVSGWDAQLTYQHEGQQTVIRINLLGRTEDPLTGLAGTLETYRPSNKNEDAQALLKETTPGIYEAELPKMSKGLWKATISFTGDNQEVLFRKTFRLHIKQETETKS